MRILMIAAIALLVLGGGGAGAYFYFSKDAVASAGPEAEKKAAEHAKKQAQDEKGKSEFVELDVLILPIVDDNGVSQTVSMVVALEVSGAGDADKVKGMEPKLKDAFIQDMYGVLNRHAALKGGVIQVGMIKQRLNKISNDVMGTGVVDDVLLQVVQQRPI